MDSPEEMIFALEKQISCLQIESEPMRASGNDLLKEETALKELNTALADMVANLNGISLNSEPLPRPIAMPEIYLLAPVLIVSQKSLIQHYTQAIELKARAWIMDMWLKLTADTQLF